MSKIHPRYILEQLKTALATMPVVVVTGARQTGKTTLVRDILAEDRRFYTLDDLSVLEQAKNSPDVLLAEQPVTIDEVQRAPELLLAIKRRVDIDRRPGAFLLTGSVNPALMNAVSDSLAGRAYYLELPPFCPSEWTEQPEVINALGKLFDPRFDTRQWPVSAAGEWTRWLLRGGLAPAITLGEHQQRGMWFSGFVRTYLERDLRQLAAVANLPDFQRYMRLVANRVARPVNQSEIARDASIVQQTGSRYLNLLETGYQVSRLPTFATNPVKALVKAKKLMWSDSGVAAWLAGLTTVDAVRARPERGFWFEQALFSTLQTWQSLDPGARSLWYWRDRGGREVDFVLNDHGRLVACECKVATTVRTADTRGLVAFAEALGKNAHLVRSVVFYLGEEVVPLGENTVGLPVGSFFPVFRPAPG